jgi:hypothetical protein
VGVGAEFLSLGNGGVSWGEGECPTFESPLKLLTDSAITATSIREPDTSSTSGKAGQAAPWLISARPPNLVVLSRWSSR